jgi:protein TonB
VSETLNAKPKRGIDCAWSTQDAAAAMDDSLIYRKTRRGATELAAATHGMLSPSARRVLILLDGHRTLAELADMFGAGSVQHIIADLEHRGFARQIDTLNPDMTTQSLATHVYQSRPAPLDPRSHRGPNWAVLALFLAAAALGPAYWYFAHTHHAADQATAAASPSEAGRESLPAVSREVDGPGAIDSAPAIREVALSALPAVTVKPTSGLALEAADTEAVAPEDTVAARGDTAALAPAALIPADALAEPPTPGRRSTERAVPPAPTPVAPARLAPEAAPLTETESSAATNASSSAPAIAAAPLASAAPVARPQPPASDAPTGLKVSAAPAPAGDAVVPVVAAPPSPAAAAPAAPDGAPPPEQLASLAPPERPKSGPVQLRPRRHDPPEYPAYALRAKILKGNVVARVRVNAEGRVEKVDIVRATPPIVFDDEVKRALSNWTFDPPGESVDTTVELDFKK